MLGSVITPKLRLLLKLSEKSLLACQKNFADCCEKGSLIGSILLGVHMSVDDGATNAADFSETEFRTATQFAFEQAFIQSQPAVLEPTINIVITAPNESRRNH